MVSRFHLSMELGRRVTRWRTLLKMSAMKRVALSIFLLLALVGVSAGEDKQASLRFLVVRDYNGKPVRNAGVVMHPVQTNGKQSRGGLELKTDSEGKASFDGVPYGKLRVQVLAPGFQTYGEDFDIDKPDMEITVKLKRPQGQYSIYDEHPEEKKEEPKK